MNIQHLYSTTFVELLNITLDEIDQTCRNKLIKEKWEYRSGTIISKSFVGKVLLRNKWNSN